MSRKFWPGERFFEKIYRAGRDRGRTATIIDYDITHYESDRNIRGSSYPEQNARWLYRRIRDQFFYERNEIKKVAQ